MIQCIDTETESFIDCPESSNLFINDIPFNQYQTAMININSDVEWDYEDINGVLVVSVNGGVLSGDSEKLQGFINSQYEYPNNEDLTAVVSNLSLYVPYLAWFGFFAFVFYLFKKIF